MRAFVQCPQALQEDGYELQRKDCLGVAGGQGLRAFEHCKTGRVVWWVHGWVLLLHCNEVGLRLRIEVAGLCQCL